MEPTFVVELESMERMLIQMELTVIAGDHESYNISTEKNKPAYINFQLTPVFPDVDMKIVGYIDSIGSNMDLYAHSAT